MSGMTPEPMSVTEAIEAANIGAGGMRVDPQALLRASNILRAESDRLNNLLAGYAGRTMRPCGPDPISGPAAAAFQTKIDAILNEAQAYTDNLAEGADALKQHAMSYGITDEQARQSFEKFQAEQVGRVVDNTMPGSDMSAASPMSALVQQYTPPPPDRAPGDMRPTAHRQTGAPAYRMFPDPRSGSR